MNWLVQLVLDTLAVLLLTAGLCGLIVLLYLAWLIFPWVM